MEADTSDQPTSSSQMGWLFSNPSSTLMYTCLLAPILLIILKLSQFYMDMRRRAKAVNLLPHDPIHWLWGHLHLFPGPNEAGLAYQREKILKYPRAHSIWFGNNIRPAVSLNHPDTMKIILRTTEPKPMGYGVYSYGLPWLGDGLLLASGKKWARNRRLLTPAFHFDILKNYVLVKNRACDIFLHKLDKVAREDRNFEFFSNVSLLTFDIILRCSFSYENDVQIEGEDHPYVQAVSRLGDLWVKRSLKPWQHFDLIYYFTSDYREFKKHCDYVHSISGQVIEQRKKYLADAATKGHSPTGNGKKDRYLDFLDILLMARDEDGKSLTDIEIRNEVDTFLFEGHDTTASAISWALYSLAGNMEHQILCQQEIDEILVDRDCDDITWEDLHKLKYLTLCIKESMRLHCPVPFIQRETSQDLKIEGVTLPKGTVLDIHIYNMHHNPQIWDSPMEFRPSRFLPENFDKMDSFAFVPFSAGPRNCIGQNFAMHEQKIVLARILRSFTIHLDPEVKVEKKVGVVMKTQNGMPMKAVPRSA